MLINKTRAAELAGVSRRAFYNHIPQKRISVVKDDDGSEKIELSELERVYGKEVVARNLKRLTEEEGQGTDGTVHDREPARTDRAGQGAHELFVLRERLRNLEEQRAQLESHQRRERDQFQEEIANLREGLKRAQDHQTQLSALLTHQNDDQAGRGADHVRKLQELETRVSDLKKLNHRVLRELKAERSKPLWRRIFG